MFISEPEIGGPYSIQTYCENNGARIVRFEGSQNCSEGEGVTEQVIPWNYCFNGQIKLKYKKQVASGRLYVAPEETRVAQSPVKSRIDEDVNLVYKDEPVES